MITINLLRDWQKYDESFPPVIGEVNGQNFIASCGMIVKSTPEAEDVLRKIPRDFSTYYNEFIENYRNSMFIRMLDTDHRKRQRYHPEKRPEWIRRNSVPVAKGNYCLNYIYIDVLREFHPDAKITYFDDSIYVIAKENDEFVGILMLAMHGEGQEEMWGNFNVTVKEVDLNEQKIIHQMLCGG